MKLPDYISCKKLTASAFAATCGVAPSTITRLLRSEYIPDLATIRKIDTATGGKVKPRDFYWMLET